MAAFVAPDVGETRDQPWQMRDVLIGVFVELAREAIVASLSENSLDGDFRIEEPAYLPLTVDGEEVSISGVIDLLCMTPDGVEIVDYKTDRGRHAKPEYRKQVSVYYHVVTQCFPDWDVSASIFYTEDGTRVPITPLTEEELVALVRAEMATSSAAPAG